MTARYVIRLDDACPTMAPAPWSRLEEAFDELGICPLVAVIPDCRDPELALAPFDPQFWDRVRRWQAKGWGIAMHGLTHVYHPDPPGARSLIPFHRRGEFVGLPLERQCAIVAESWCRFRDEGVEPKFFIAPSHSFDSATLEALSRETCIRTVSDGLSMRVFRRYGFAWIPQQLWRFRDASFGLWTVCLHPNTMTMCAIDAAIADMKRFSRAVVAPHGLPAPAPYGWHEAAFGLVYRALLALKRVSSRQVVS